MTSPIGDIRPLRYPLTRVENLEGEYPNTPPVTSETLDWLTIDPDERVPIVLNLSLNEYISLATSIDVGRDIAYGENSIYIWWIWVRSIMNFCEQMLNCIENDSDVQNSINNLVLNQTNESLREFAQSQSNLVLGQGNNPTCDLDALFGGVISVIDRANQTNLDVLEQFEVSTNSAELFSLIFPNTAEDGTSFINAVLDWIAWIQDSILENYEAEITTAYLEELYCDLFCLVRDDCILTPEILVSYFADRLSSSINIFDLWQNTVDFLTSGSWGGTQIADVMFLSQFAIRGQVGGILSKLGFADVDKDFRIGLLQPSSIWTILCDCVDTWEHVFDFSENDGGFIAVNGGGNAGTTFGNYIASVGWDTEDKQWSTTPLYRRGLAIQRTFDDTLVYEIDVLWNFEEGSASSTVTMLVMRGELDSVPVGETLVKTNTDVASGSNQSVTLEINDVIDEIFVLLTPSSQPTASYSGSARVKSITVRGEGTNPFE